MAIFDWPFSTSRKGLRLAWDAVQDSVAPSSVQYILFGPEISTNFLFNISGIAQVFYIVVESLEYNI